MLRQGRVAAGLGREEMARILRVPLSVVDALEEERFGDLPRPVYLRGFVGAWCRAAGMDEGAARDALVRALGAAASLPSPLPAVPRGTGITVGARTARRGTGFKRLFAIIAAFFVLAAGGYATVKLAGSGRAVAPAGVPPASLSVLDQSGACMPDSGPNPEPEEVFGE